MGRVFARAHIFQNPYKRWAGVTCNPSAQETDVVASWAIDRLCVSGEAPVEKWRAAEEGTEHELLGHTCTQGLVHAHPQTSHLQVPTCIETGKHMHIHVHAHTREGWGICCSFVEGIEVVLISVYGQFRFLLLISFSAEHL